MAGETREGGGAGDTTGPVVASCVMAPSSKKRKAAPGSIAEASAAASTGSSPAAASTGPSGARGGGHRAATGKLGASSSLLSSSSSMPANAAAAKLMRDQLHSEINYKPLTLQDIHDRVQQLCYSVPAVPEPAFGLKSAVPMLRSDEDDKGETENPSDASAAATSGTNGQPRAGSGDGGVDAGSSQTHVDKAAVKMWATSVQLILEELNILMGCVYPATYVWGTDRSGAADQNLSLLNAELVRSQDHIATLVSPRITEVLTPVVSLVTKKTVTTKNEATGEEVKINYFETTHEDPDYVHHSHVVLARNAAMLRQVILANLDKMLQAIKDFLAAQHKDSQHDSRGFVY